MLNLGNAKLQFGMSQFPSKRVVRRLGRQQPLAKLDGGLKITLRFEDLRAISLPRRIVRPVGPKKNIRRTRRL